MAKNLPETGEASAALPAPPPTEVATVAQASEPKDVTSELQKLVDAAEERANVAAAAEKPDPKQLTQTVDLPTGAIKLFGALKIPANVKVTGLATPEEHAKSLAGGVKTVERFARIGSQAESFQLFHWQHAAAEALHGWKQHAHHEALPIQLTKEAYENALRAAAEPVTRVVKDFEGRGKTAVFKAEAKVNSHKAAELGVPTHTTYEPFAPALSPHAGKGL